MFSTQPLLMKNKCWLWDDDISATLLRLRLRALLSLLTGNTHITCARRKGNLGVQALNSEGMKARVCDSVCKVAVIEDK